MSPVLIAPPAECLYTKANSNINPPPNKKRVHSNIKSYQTPPKTNLTKSSKNLQKITLKFSTKKIAIRKQNPKKLPPTHTLAPK